MALARTIALQSNAAVAKGNSGELIHSTLKLPSLSTIPDEPGMRLAAKHAAKVIWPVHCAHAHCGWASMPCDCQSSSSCKQKCSKFS